MSFLVYLCIYLRTCSYGFSIPPVPTSIGFLLLAGFLSKSHFQTYWAEVKTIFNPKSPDLVDIKDFYFDNADVDEEEEEEEGEEDKEKKRRRSRRRRTFLVAEHRGRIVGTTAVREAPGQSVRVLVLAAGKVVVVLACGLG